MKILVSKCLLGVNCRYAGDGCKNEKVVALGKDNELIGICPEVIGGLSTPRSPSERVGEKVMMKTGEDVTAEYKLGAEKALEIALKNKVDYCVLKAKSPSCGSGMIYDGTFSGKLIAGDGVTTELLKKFGFIVKNENNI